MTVDEMKEHWVHKDDVQILRDIYKNEMTLRDLLEEQEEYIDALENAFETLKDEMYNTNIAMKEVEKTILMSVLRYSDIKKD
ncbi:hypothetical protein [Jeotgalibaca sp. A127]|uniref:hypothetical protein n=1 Tax=Jeotgalibaca sp. A127 TaxID=3457324 RepID=UPI003FD04152